MKRNRFQEITDQCYHARSGLSGEFGHPFELRTTRKRSYPMPTLIEMYDTTLRDGAQGPGVKFSSDDQLRVVRALDELGIRYIEGGQPGSNPKAVELFQRTKDMDLKIAKMAAFGSTRNPKSTVEDDSNIQALLSAETEIVTIFAKSSRFQATEILRVSLEENLKIVEESVAYLRAQKRRVFLDAEHFFDGFFDDNEYALAVLEQPHGAGVEIGVVFGLGGDAGETEILAKFCEKPFLVLLEVVENRLHREKLMVLQLLHNAFAGSCRQKWA